MWHFTAKKSLAAILGGKLSEEVFCRPSTAPVTSTVAHLDEGVERSTRRRITPEKRIIKQSTNQSISLIHVIIIAHHKPLVLHTANWFHKISDWHVLGSSVFLTRDTVWVAYVQCGLDVLYMFWSASTSWGDTVPVKFVYEAHRVKEQKCEKFLLPQCKTLIVNTSDDRAAKFAFSMAFSAMSDLMV